MPEEHASIVLSQKDPRRTITDSSGSFVIDDLEPGRYAIAITSPWTVEHRLVEVVRVTQGRTDPLAFFFTAAGTHNDVGTFKE